MLYVFFPTRIKRNVVLESELKKVKGSLKLRSLSQACWVARSESIDSFWMSLESILEVLKKFQDKQITSDEPTNKQAMHII